MDTRLQVLLYVNNIATRTHISNKADAMHPNAKDMLLFEKLVEKKIAWLLVPDAITSLLNCGRRASHFEVAPDNCGTSWLQYPSATTLKTLSAKNFDQNVRYFIASSSYPESPIEEKIYLGKFDIRNWQHEECGALRCHLIQEICRNKFLREMIDDHDRANRNFFIRHNNRRIAESELRQQIALWEEYGFIKAVKMFYENTGILADAEWFDCHVLASLRKFYPDELADTTYSAMAIRPELNERIQDRRFELTTAEKAIKITDNVEKSLDDFFKYTLFETFNDF